MMKLKNTFSGDFTIMITSIGMASEQALKIDHVNSVEFENITQDYLDMQGNIIHRQKKQNQLVFSCDCLKDQQHKLQEFSGFEVWLLIGGFNEKKEDDMLPPMRGFISKIVFEATPFDWYEAKISFIGDFDYLKEQGEIAVIKEKVNKKINDHKPMKERTLKRETQREFNKRMEKKKKDRNKRTISFM